MSQAYADPSSQAYADPT
ncbi:hypothetical protein MTO96_038713, partial [Rhipicephalus appendiculatus]